MSYSVLYQPGAKGVDRALSNDTGSTGREDDYFTKEHEQIPDWRAYWDRKGTWWRQERLITKERRDWLMERLSSGEQPFKGLWLERADIEWLLVADGVGQHKQEPSDIPWLLNGVLSEERQRQRGALTWLVMHGPPEPAREPSLSKALVNTGLNLRGALVREGTNLTGLPLIGAQFQDADLAGVQLQGASLWRAQLQGANLEEVNLQGAALEEAHLQRAKLGRAHLQRAELGRAHLQRAKLGKANLEEANLQGAALEKAHLQRAELKRANLQRAKLGKANLQGADLRGAQLQGADLQGAQLQGTGNLEPAMLSGAIFDLQTNLLDAVLGDRDHGFVSVADVMWNGVNLAVVDWSGLLPEPGILPWCAGTLAGWRARLAGLRMRVDGRLNWFAQSWFHRRSARLDQARTQVHDRQTALINRARRAKGAQLGDEHVARATPKKHTMWLDLWLERYHAAIRANRQLALALQGQGLNEVGAELAYRAQVLQRSVLWQERRWASGLVSWVLERIAGYGYRPWRAFRAYVATLIIFTGLNLLVPEVFATKGHLTLGQAIIESVLSFHGRGLLPTQGIATDVHYGYVAAIEAFVGLIIEATFIATLTQRFFR
jgi:uncharacterized protein YjbI with pentapeptide repeats